MTLPRWAMRDTNGRRADERLAAMNRIGIYTLTDPRDNLVHYVGSSKHPHKRLTEHRTILDRSARGRWIADLKANDIRPLMEVVEQVPPSLARDAEVRWTEYFLKLGHPLCSYVLKTLNFKPSSAAHEAIKKLIDAGVGDTAVAVVEAALIEMARLKCPLK